MDEDGVGSDAEGDLLILNYIGDGEGERGGGKRGGLERIFGVGRAFSLFHLLLLILQLLISRATSFV